MEKFTREYAAETLKNMLEVQEAIKNNSCNVKTLENCDNKIFALTLAINEINKYPNAKWEPLNPDSNGYTNGFICSNCNEHVYLAAYCKKMKYKICPHCGAFMNVTIEV